MEKGCQSDVKFGDNEGSTSYSKRTGLMTQPGQGEARGTHGMSSDYCFLVDYGMYSI